MQTAIHGLTPSFEELRTDITDTSCLSTPQLCYSLSDFVKRGCGFVNGRIDIHRTVVTLTTLKNPCSQFNQKIMTVFISCSDQSMISEDSQDPLELPSSPAGHSTEPSTPADSNLEGGTEVLYVCEASIDAASMATPTISAAARASIEADRKQLVMEEINAAIMQKKAYEQKIEKEKIQPDGKDRFRVACHMPWQSGSMHNCDSWLNPDFEELRTDITDTSCLSTPQLCYSLSDFVKRGCGFVNGRIDIHRTVVTLTTLKNPCSQFNQKIMTVFISCSDQSMISEDSQDPLELPSSPAGHST
ncbi:hypothetical protein GWK47_020434 [Chionoecetes opilio]|uniref:Uncharacterized protein n=1 Tax=Chionoecetes opilio TaxID=41210 RepID=A0A8J4XT93_CHIOP|nr:hypothetical protein GWK47_020434 [Chionoecetes opilio]